MVQATQTVELKPETLQAYAKHIGEAEAVVEQALRGDRQFLWSDGSPQRIAQLRKGATIAELSSGKRPIQVSDGLIHDWIGATSQWKGPWRSSRITTIIRTSINPR